MVNPRLWCDSHGLCTPDPTCSLQFMFQSQKMKIRTQILYIMFCGYFTNSSGTTFGIIRGSLEVRGLFIFRDHGTLFIINHQHHCMCARCYQMLSVRNVQWHCDQCINGFDLMATWVFAKMLVYILHAFFWQCGKIRKVLPSAWVFSLKSCCNWKWDWW